MRTRRPGLGAPAAADYSLLVIDDRELWACASFLLQQHGAGARSFAAKRARALFAAGEIEGHQVFLQIEVRIGQLEAVAPDCPTH
jgi:hypothetical protein